MRCCKRRPLTARNYLKFSSESFIGFGINYRGRVFDQQRVVHAPF